MSRGERRNLAPQQSRMQQVPLDVPLIGQQQARMSLNMGIVPHDAPYDTPIEMEMPPQSDGKGGAVIVKHVWGGQDKTVRLAGTMLSLNGLDIDDQDEINNRCRLALRVAQTLERLQIESREARDATAAVTPLANGAILGQDQQQNDH